MRTADLAVANGFVAALALGQGEPPAAPIDAALVASTVETLGAVITREDDC